jgi:hypothetical protein
MVAKSMLAICVLVFALIGGFLFYSSRTNAAVLFSHGTPEVPQGRMFTIFNPFRNRDAEHAAERLIDDLRTGRCEQVVQDIDGSQNYDPRVCDVMSRNEGHALIWRQDGESNRVLVYAVPEKQARLWVGFRRDEVGFVVSSVSVIR